MLTASVLMIEAYRDRNHNVYVIKDMKDDHLQNAYRYFSIKRLELKDKPGITGLDLLRISLLINALWQEIEKRELYKY